MLNKLLAKFFHKIKIIHSIPGRLRILVPGLKEIPKVFHAKDEFITDLIKMHPGINDISCSFVTNKILIHYNNDLISEKKIMAWINQIENELIDKYDLIKNIDQTNFEEVVNSISSELKEKLK